MSTIRAAKEWGRRPTAAIMGDDDFGNKCPVTHKVVREGWTTWDYLIIRAVQTIEDHTGDDGLLVWDKESDRVDILAQRKIDPFQAAVEAVTGAKKYKKIPGERFVPKKVLLGGEWPTMKEYYDNILREQLEDIVYEEDDREITQN